MLCKAEVAHADFQVSFDVVPGAHMAVLAIICRSLPCPYSMCDMPCFCEG